MLAGVLRRKRSILSRREGELTIGMGEAIVVAGFVGGGASDRIGPSFYRRVAAVQRRSGGPAGTGLISPSPNARVVHRKRIPGISADCLSLPDPPWRRAGGG